MERRRFLGLTAAGAFAAALPTAVWAASPAWYTAVLADPELVGVLGDPGAIRRIGELYRRSHPFENDVHVLQADITAGTSAAAGASDLRVAIEKKVRDDFACGRTVQIDGWMLSRTEARQCALRSLLGS